MEGHLRPCEVKGRKAFFHGIFQHSVVVGPSALRGGHPGGTISNSLAIIEYENGVVTECYPYELKFTDRGESGSGEDTLPPIDLSTLLEKGGFQR